MKSILRANCLTNVKSACSGLSVGYDDEPSWIQCGECDFWFDVKCTDLDPETDEGELEEIKLFCKSFT